MCRYAGRNERETAMSEISIRPDCVGHQAAVIVRLALAEASEQSGMLTPQTHAQVHRAVDLLRYTKADPILLSKIEAMSCLMARMGRLHRQGRVNAYASALLQLRTAARAL
jgi:hypothetical protein